MTILEFLRRFLWHVTTAATVLFIVLLIGEYFVPGSVLPFIDLVDVAVGLLVLLVLNVIFSPLGQGGVRGGSKKESLN